MKTIHTPKSSCWKCGYIVSAASSPCSPRATPRPGDITMCLNCGAIATFTDDLTIAKPSDEELQKIMAEYPELIEMQVTRAGVIAEDLSLKQKRKL